MTAPSASRPRLSLPSTLTGNTPGIGGDEVETLLDIDYAHATAPGTPIHAYISSDLYNSIRKA